MKSLSTRNIKVCVETFYQEEISQPENNEFMFAYRITIENQSDETIKLVKRKWIITDAFGKERMVEGEGVIGKQPVIEPDCFHQYVSGCHLKTEVGKMRGVYIMQRVKNDSYFEVEIPSFQMTAPFKLN